MGGKDIMIEHVSYKTDSEGAFIDVFDTNDHMRITDYCLMKKEIFILSKKPRLGDIKEKIKLSNMQELKIMAEVFINAAISILNSENAISTENSLDYYGSSKPLFSKKTWRMDFVINEREKQLLINQLVFDMLYDIYLNQSKKMSYNEYADMMSKVVEESRGTINKKLEASMKQYYQMIKYSQLKEELEMLGVNAEQYAEYYKMTYRRDRKNKRPKFVWDLLYYNRTMITYRQYRRKLTKEGRNYHYENIVGDLKDYSDFINKLLPVDNESVKLYFNKSMDYFSLESYKRIDFMLKLAVNIPKMGITNIEDIAFLVKRFHPQVMVPYEENNNIKFGNKCKYYKPLFMIEDILHKQMCEGKCDISDIGIKLQKYQIIRAKAYEMAKYHLKLELMDYKNIKEFLLQSFNMRSYHESNEVWNIIKSKEWKKMDSGERKYVREIIRRFIAINKILFAPSDKRKINITENE